MGKIWAFSIPLSKLMMRKPIMFVMSVTEKALVFIGSIMASPVALFRYA